jgi:hypothetical protein
MSAMRLSFHVSGGLEQIDSFWEARGLDRSRERLLFAPYSRGSQPHTVYLQWSRSHEGCSDVLLGIDARRASQVWPHRSEGTYRLRLVDLRAFIERIREMELPWGIRARYSYPSTKDLNSIIRLPLPHTRPTSVAFDLLDEEQRPVMNVTYKRWKRKWFVVVALIKAFPFPEGDNFFQVPYETGCLLGTTITKELLP